MPQIKRRTSVAVDDLTSPAPCYNRPIYEVRTGQITRSGKVRSLNRRFFSREEADHFLTDHIASLPESEQTAAAYFSVIRKIG